MLSNPTSAIETRRRTHRRQNSTPNIEVAQLKKLPAANNGLQRAHSQRGHRRGLSLDNPRIHIASKLKPTLGPISQDDISVSIGTNNAGSSQYQHTSVAQPSMVQPGHHHNQFHNPMFSAPLGLQTYYPVLTQSPNPMQFSPHHIHSPHAFNNSPTNLSPTNPSGPFSRHQPTMQQLNALEEHIKSVYGGGVQINILPTPIPTPQKRLSMAVDGIDMTPTPTNPADLHLDPTMVNDFKYELQNSPDGSGYDSPFDTSPNHSVSCSPHAPAVKSFVDITPTSFPMHDSMMFSSQTTLADVELGMPSNGADSPARSPRPVSIADLNLDGSIEQTGISQEAIQQYISEQDPLTHRWTCLFPDCDAKTFGRRENIRSHVQTHLGDRQYRCNHCSKCFVRQHDLKRHAKIHSGNKPYKCPCGGGFARQDALTRHRQRGMCVGGFPNAIRKKVPRGRPKKIRPDMEARYEKAVMSRERANSSSSSVESGPEDSPSPHPMDAPGIDTAKLVDLPEESQIDSFELNHSTSNQHFHHPRPSYSASFNNILNATADHDQGRYGSRNSMVFTPPASSPAEIDLKYLAHSPHDSLASPVMPATPPPASAGASSANPLDLSNTPPTSPLLCTSTSAASDASLISANASMEHSLAVTMSILDDLRLATADAPMDVHDPLGMSFASNDPVLSTYGGLEYLTEKHDEGMSGDLSFSANDDDSFRMWGIDDQL